MNEPVISLQNICKRFGRTTALDHVSLEIPAGVVFALLGENGAGKTTMIRILTGFLKPDEGSAEAGWSVGFLGIVFGTAQILGASLAVVGGRALTEEMRQQMKYATYCDNMQHLEGFAQTLLNANLPAPIPPGS